MRDDAVSLLSDQVTKLMQDLEELKKEKEQFQR
jgi:hypothetical protein